MNPKIEALKKRKQVLQERITEIEEEIKTRTFQLDLDVSHHKNAIIHRKKVEAYKFQRDSRKKTNIFDRKKVEE